MELELTLGDSPAPTTTPASMPVPAPAEEGEDHELMLELGVGIGHRAEEEEEEKQQEDQKNDVQAEDMEEGEEAHRLPGSPSFELSLRSAVLPESPETGNTCNLEACTRGFDVNTVPALEEDEATVNCLSVSSSSLQMEFSARQAADHEGMEDEENGGGGGRGVRKKLRLSKEQSEFLEESFKEQSTLNPKQKLDLAKRLNLRPRQVEVWFQNRRARTKLKQTEVDRQYLKRWCETLTRENRRLQREVAELRALRTAHRPFYPHLSASRCPSCDSVTTARLSPPVVSSPAGAPQATSAALFTKSGLYPFAVHPVLRRRPSATS